MASLLNWENATQKCRGLVLLLSLRTGTEKLLLQRRKTGRSSTQRSGKEGFGKGCPPGVGKDCWAGAKGSCVTWARPLPAGEVGGGGFISPWSNNVIPEGLLWFLSGGVLRWLPQNKTRFEPRFTLRPFSLNSSFHSLSIIGSSFRL